MLGVLRCFETEPAKGCIRVTTLFQCSPQCFPGSELRGLDKNGNPVAWTTPIP